MRRRAAALVLLAVVAVPLGLPGAASAGTPARAPRTTLRLQTVPPLAGVVVRVDGNTAVSDAAGRITVGVRDFIELERRIAVPPVQIAPDRRVVFDRFRGELASGARGGVIELGVRTSRLVGWRFIDRFGTDVPPGRVESMRLRSSTGEIIDIPGPELGQPRWVNESRTQQGPQGLVSKPLYYVVDTVVVSSAGVVNRAQQRFVPWDQQQWTVQLLFYRVSFASTDLFFASEAGHGVELTGPDGQTRRLPFGADGVVAVGDLPRGTYSVRVYGGGVSFARPLSISKDQAVSLDTISWVDVALVALAVLVVAVGLILIGRPRARIRVRAGWRGLRRAGAWSGRRLRAAPRRVRWSLVRRALAAGGALLLIALPLLPAPAAARTTSPAAADPVPVLAYYYIWFTPTSWNRAKVDYPLLGRYSSDDVEIMRRHVALAKAAGIRGFLVSWKDTPQLDERLARLVEVARAADFRLGIVYQGLDFSRDPLANETVRQDLTHFANLYAADPVFQIFDRPLVIWTGSDQHSTAEIEQTVGALRARLLLLGSAKNVADVAREGPAVDGQAYYWSSVDPTVTDTTRKLAAMATEVHGRGGLWIAPVAPGFDGRLLGGQREVPRRDGGTLHRSFEAARSSDPDAIGLISWNEFSENTHVEPSERYGWAALQALADILGAHTTFGSAVDSSDTGGRFTGLSTWGALLVVASTAGAIVGLAAWRRRASRARARTDPGGQA